MKPRFTEVMLPWSTEHYIKSPKIDSYLSDELIMWLRSETKSAWQWDDCYSTEGVRFLFENPSEAMLFKLTWA